MFLVMRTVFPCGTTVFIYATGCDFRLEGPQKMETSELIFNGGKQKVKVKWGKCQPKHLYVVWMEQSVTTKICLHWIMDICYTAAIPVQFKSHPCVYHVMVCGLNSVKARSEVYYEVCGTAKLTLSGASESMEIDLELKDTLWEEDVDNQFTTKESFMLNINYTLPPTHTLHNLPKQDPNQFYLIKVHQELPRKDLLFLHPASKGDYYTFPVDFVAASDYIVTVFVPNIIHCGTLRTCWALEICAISRPLHFRAYMTKTEVTELLNKGESYARQRNPNFTEINYLYRNKWYHYYYDVLFKKMGIMSSHYKDNSGDRASTLHQNVKGLFFGANIDFKTRAPPNASYFGPMRLNVPAIYFLSHYNNLYFADFYCHYTNHKVMLVVTNKEKHPDQWCNSRLVKLDQFRNPFLFRTLAGKVYITTGIIVEVFYTDNIDVGFLLQYGGAFFTCVRPIGPIRSLVRGIPKNPNCDICKLNHRKTKDKQDQERIQNSST